MFVDCKWACDWMGREMPEILEPLLAGGLCFIAERARLNCFAQLNPKQNMQNKTNIKSMVIGAALGALLVLSIAAATTQTSPYGRFQLATGDGYIFKIDTTTG